MQITRPLLEEATARGLLHEGQSVALWAFLAEHHRDVSMNTPGFKPAHILYYLGGLVAIGAMTLFMTLGWERLGAGGLFAIASAYIFAATLGTEVLLHKKRLPLPAGITGALAVALVPLALRGVKFRAEAAALVLRRNLLIYGLGGLVAPFVGIKLIDIIVTALGAN